MKDLAAIIADNAVTDLKAPTTAQEAIYLHHERIRANARLNKIAELLKAWGLANAG